MKFNWCTSTVSTTLDPRLSTILNVQNHFVPKGPRRKSPTKRKIDADEDGPNPPPAKKIKKDSSSPVSPKKKKDATRIKNCQAKC